jgi:hypothetical protein
MFASPSIIGSLTVTSVFHQRQVVCGGSDGKTINDA